MQNKESSEEQIHRPTWLVSLLGFLFFLIISFSAALPGAFFMPGEWYKTLAKPSFNPPGWIFGPVWTILYTVMAIAAWLVWRKSGFRKAATAIIVFLFQLVLNALWTVLFFGMHSPKHAFIDITCLWVAILATAAAFWNHSKPAGLLMVPYLLWVSFAMLLNFFLWRMN